ncbi:hypothetical protein AX16_002919 [Volvariella volvacea WC 439]|nr:hypothetical protein AX16_002919 [Volvariella volvacea WC 439]
MYHLQAEYLPVLHTALLNLVFISQLTAAIILTIGLAVAWPDDVEWPTILSSILCWFNALALACVAAHRILWPNQRHCRMRYAVGFGVSFLASLPAFISQLVRYNSVVMLFSDFDQATILAGVVICLITLSFSLSFAGLPWVLFAKYPFNPTPTAEDASKVLILSTSPLPHPQLNKSKSSTLLKPSSKSPKSIRTLTISTPSLTTMPKELDNTNELKSAAEKMYISRFEDVPL